MGLEHFLPLENIEDSIFEHVIFQATLRQVAEFFKEVVRRVNQFSTDVQENLKKATEKSDDSEEATPMPELRPIDTVE